MKLLFAILLSGCATAAVEWQRSGACIPLCQSAAPTRGDGAALFDATKNACLCSWTSDPVTKDHAIDITIDLRTLTCHEFDYLNHAKPDR